MKVAISGAQPSVAQAAGTDDRNMRKAFQLLAAAALFATALSGCMSDGEFSQLFTNAYGARVDGGYDLPAIPIYKVPPEYRRAIVRYDTDEEPF